VIGRVVRIGGKTFDVTTSAGRLTCEFRGRLKKDKQAVVRLVAVGDEVEVTPKEGTEGIIEKVLPRRSKLSRPSAANSRKEQVIVANVDSILIVESARNPDFDPLTVDRCTVMASAAGIPAALCVNKTDLGSAIGIDVYPQLGIPVFHTSAIRGEGLEKLRAFLDGKTTVFIGPSGVGKSSLLNALHPAAGVKTGKVSDRTGGGRHTTTWAELVELAPGTYVTDTPGLEIFALWEITPDSLRDYFPEFVDPATRCKYRDCSHTAEPKCAVLEAVKSGAIPPSRHKHYLSIRRSLVEQHKLFEY
jgi:ribosome biogenesis GTPase